MTTYMTKWDGSIKTIDATVDQSKKIQAGVERGFYEFGQIPESDYLTCLDTKNDAAYVLLRIGAGTTQQIGCSCDYFKTEHKVCEHLLALRDIDMSKLDAPPNWLVEFLQVDNRWHIDDDNRLVPPSTGSEKVVPEVVASVPPIDEEPEEPPKKEKRTCPHCNLTMPESRYEKHLSVCKKNPAKQKPQGSPTVELPVQEKPKAPVIPPDPKIDIGVDVKPPEHPEVKTYPCKICGTEYPTIDEALNCIEKCKKKQEASKLPALIDEDMTWSASQIEVMRKTVAVGTTNEEFAYFLNVAKAAGLNPFLREIYCWKTEKGQLTIATGRDGYLAIAKRDPKFRGMQSMEVCENDDFSINNEITPEGIKQTITHNITNFKDRGVVIGAWARADFDDQEPIIVYASADEYNTKKNVWTRNPSAMMRKVPEAMALKRGAGISGLVTDAEVSDGGIIDVEVT